MAFRDDVEAANARAEAAEARVRELERRNRELTARRPQQSGRTAVWITLAGACALMAWLVGPRPLVILPALLLLLALAPVWWQRVAGPSEALILIGRKHRAADGTALGYRLVRPGEAATRVPFVDHVERVDLSDVPIEVEVDDAYGKGCVFRLRGTAIVAITPEEPVIHRAIERFLGRPRDEIAAVARGTLEGILRGTIAEIDPFETAKMAETLARAASKAAEDDLSKMGLVLRTLKIERVERVERVE
ncbi:MAG: hypothetical protein HYY06_11650 [Deltaproteobacteria bacterium]|nr:hypothetical protein [Deltaproteobacteria bacterium]